LLYTSPLIHYNVYNLDFATYLN